MNNKHPFIVNTINVLDIALKLSLEHRSRENINVFITLKKMIMLFTTKAEASEEGGPSNNFRGGGGGGQHALPPPSPNNPPTFSFSVYVKQ